MNQPAIFWDKIANRYSEKPIDDEAAYRTKLQVTRKILRPDMRVLEIGCGTGSTAIEHAPYVKHIHAIDYSAKMIEIAERKACEKNIDNITFEQFDIDAFSSPDQSFDVVLGLNILHLLENKEEVINRIFRSLIPGGTFVSSTHCLGDTMRFIKVIAPIGKFFGLMPLVKVFTTDELEGSLAAAGFDINHKWQPDKGKALFMLAQKPSSGD